MAVPVQLLTGSQTVRYHAGPREQGPGLGLSLGSSAHRAVRNSGVRHSLPAEAADRPGDPDTRSGIRREAAGGHWALLSFAHARDSPFHNRSHQRTRHSPTGWRWPAVTPPPIAGSSYTSPFEVIGRSLRCALLLRMPWRQGGLS